MNKTKIILIAILTVSFGSFRRHKLRLASMGCAGRTRSVFGALKMMELKTLIPANHIGEF